MKTKRLVLVVLIIFLNGLIFAFSNQDGNKSVSLSDSVTIKFIDKYAEVANKELTQSRKLELVKSSRTLVRKTAHFTLYLIMGVLVYMFISTFNIKHHVLISALICILFASFDEAHQLFTSGRSGQVTDVVIDTAGSLVGMLVINFGRKIKLHRKGN